MVGSIDCDFSLRTKSETIIVVMKNRKKNMNEKISEPVGSNCCMKQLKKNMLQKKEGNSIEKKNLIKLGMRETIKPKKEKK